MEIILEVYNLLSELKASMIENPRPVLLEFKPRMRGHEEASGTKYVPELMDLGLKRSCRKL
jgi:2-oxoisovalerate dehydrogenase E1 component